jgi:predicted DNA-binding transcriptional regulator AlpA
MPKWLPIRGVCNRYNVSERTVDRWTEAGALPQPVCIRRRKYWSEQDLDEHDEARKTVAQPWTCEMLDGAA